MNFIFDFDGTLVDSFKCVMEKSNLLADKYHFRKVNDEEMAHLRELSSKELLAYLGVPFYLIPQLIRGIRKHMYAEMRHLAPVPEIKPVIQSLDEAGFSLGILTSNSEENVIAWLNQHAMRDFFKFIQIESNYFSKASVLKKTLKLYQLDKEKTYYIGDETRDIEAAHENKIKSIAVSWGYHSEKLLAKYQPHLMAHHPRELLKLGGLSFDGK